MFQHQHQEESYKDYKAQNDYYKHISTSGDISIFSNIIKSITIRI